jgi:serine/threonine-protein phosphatase 2A regulatory subunit B
MAEVDLEWKFSQVFGERADTSELTDGGCFVELRKLTKNISADVLSAVSFDDSGEYLATGDKGGRIVIFQRVETPQAVFSHFSSFPSNSYWLL